ncbi:hypothetical protein [Vibrio sp.]|uniref:glycine zipper family protein n=1 Tax=Vibrio sp. TaxID=678 RepID=UPI0031204601
MITNEVLVKTSENEYIYQFNYKGQSVESYAKKRGDTVSYQVYFDGNFLFEQEYSVNNQAKALANYSIVPSSSSTDTMLVNETSWFDGLQHVKSRSATYKHPDKEKYDLDIFETVYVNGTDYIHLQIGKTASGILVNAPTWMVGSMIGAGAGVVIGSLIGPPGAVTAAAGELLLVPKLVL